MEWTSDSGVRMVVEETARDDVKEAVARCVLKAWLAGWRPRRRWQFWRRTELSTRDLARVLAWVTEQYVVGTNYPESRVKA